MDQQPLQTPPEPSNQVPPQQPPPSPQPQQPPPMPAGQNNPVAGAPNTPFEPPTAPSGPGTDFQPSAMQPASSGSKTWILWIVLLIFLILGGLFFASWEGWISLGGLEKYWKKTSPAATTTSTPTISTATAHDNTRKADLANIKDALKNYYQANQSYPIASTLQKTSDANNALTVLVPTYIAKLPVDPLSPSYYYGYTSDGKTFELTARLEDTTDPSAIDAGNGIYLYKVTNTSVETPTSSQ
jgi:hypothetical protein